MISQSNPHIPHPALRSTVYLLLGLFCLLLYFTIGYQFNDFVEQDMLYVNPTIERYALGNFIESRMEYFTKIELSAILWQWVLLIPASVFLALGISLKLNESSLETLHQRIIRMRLVSFLIVISLVTLFLIVIIRMSVLHNTQVTDDEGSYLFQAEILRTGRLYAPAHPLSIFFKRYFILENADGRWYSGYLTHRPGYMFFLALGALLRAPWLIPALSSVVTLLLLVLIARELLGADQARYVALFLVISPFFLFTSATLLPYATSLMLMTAFFWAYVKTVKTSSWPIAILAGIALGVAAFTRPFEAAAIGLPFGCHAIWLMCKEPRRYVARFVVMAMLAAGVAFQVVVIRMVVLGYRTPIPMTIVGFNLHGEGYHHTVPLALAHLGVNWLRVNGWLFGWPISLLFAAMVFFKQRRDQWDWLLIGWMASVSAFYSVYKYPGVNDTGPVYYFTLITPLVLLTVRHVFSLQQFWRRRNLGEATGPRFWPIFVIVSFAISLLTFFPHRTIYLMNLTDRIRQPYEAVKNAKVHNAIVYIKSLPNVGWIFNGRLNPPDLSDDVLYVYLQRDPALNRKLAEMYPDRSLYILTYDANENKSSVTPIQPDDFTSSNPSGPPVSHPNL